VARLDHAYGIKGAEAVDEQLIASGGIYAELFALQQRAYL
jgi:hypothetical protein